MNNQIRITIKQFIFLLIILLNFNFLYAQVQGAWVEKKLPDVLPADKFWAVGENCIIYVGKNDSMIYTYDLHSGQWHEYEQATSTPWIHPARAAEDVAMVYTDSVVIAYSALSQSFSKLLYEGTLLNSTNSSDVKLSGCMENVAYFVTDTYFYAFNAATGQWYSHELGDFGTIDRKFAYENTGYVLIKLTDDADHEKWMTFSTSTNSFYEWNYTFSPAIEMLDYGFLAWRLDSNNPDDEFFGCYSAVHNSWIQQDEHDFSLVSTSDDAENLSPRTVGIFRITRRLESSYSSHTFYIFNTILDNACEICRETNVDYSIQSYRTGAQTAVIAFRNLNDNNLEIATYRSDTHCVTSFEGSPLFVKQDVYWHNCGGKIYLAFDSECVMAGYPEELRMTSACIPVHIRQWDKSLESRYDWGITLFESNTADSAYVYSYNIINSDTMAQFPIEWGNGSYTQISDDHAVAGLLAKTDNGYKLFLYSPVHDAWTQKSAGPESPNLKISGDFLYYREPNTNLLSIFDGARNQEMDLPFGQTGYSAMQTYTWAGENFIIAYTNDNKYVSYSAITGTSNEYENDRYTNYRGEKNIVTAQKAYNYYNILTYNAIADAFIHLTLSEMQGQFTNLNVGGNTALILTRNGYLLAFDPNKDSGTAIGNMTRDIELPKSFNLAQNYPNPFNPETTIEFDLPIKTHVSLEIYNTLGVRVNRLVNQDLAAGRYRYIWQAQNVASGIYFYRLQTQYYQSVKRMIYIK
jgi:hypothetical protein